jgi:hypothetical protein
MTPPDDPADILVVRAPTINPRSSPWSCSRGGTTELVLIHRRLRPDRLESHRMGWTDIVEKLGETLDLGETEGGMGRTSQAPCARTTILFQ